MTQLDNSNISKHLGKTSEYISKYDRSILVREPRSSNREHLGIPDDRLPFTGFDVWNAYEISALNNLGLPVTAYGKITYSASSRYIVESKSLKLYLNSFNMTYFTETSPYRIFERIEEIVKQDLSELLETDVTVKLFDACKLTYNSAPAVTDLDEHITLERMAALKEISCDTYRETPELLEGVYNETSVTIQKYHSSLLKSNCRVTSQPDWGDVFITYKGNYSITPESLLKYIVSFRDECHFHEEICETVYKRLLDKFNPTELVVTCLYVRRGGIDINPTRSLKEDGIYEVFTKKEIGFHKTPRQ